MSSFSSTLGAYSTFKNILKARIFNRPGNVT
jgi:hypothetical protein